MNYLTCKQWKC